MITRELLKSLFKFNKDGSLTRLIKTNREALEGERTFGNLNSRGYRRIGINGKHYLVHRLVFFYEKGFLPARIDHKDGNKDNNRIGNLRVCTPGQNISNSKKRKDNKSGIKGIKFSEKYGSWVAVVKYKGKAYQFQRRNKKEVINWLRNKRKELHGEFAREK